jgi:hypothetical protein
MPRKEKFQRRLDADPPIKFGSATTLANDVPIDTAPPAWVLLDAPENLALTTTIGTSTAAPTAIINATWDAPPVTVVDFYIVEASESSAFPVATTVTMRADQESAAIYSLKPATLYYVRVAAYRGGVRGAFTAMSPLVDGVNRITTAGDTIPAGVPTGISATWIGYGDLLILWTNPVEANLKDVQVVVRASSGGTIYRTVYSATGRYLYPLALNFLDTAGVGDSSLYIELRSRTFSNTLGTIVNTGLITKAAPATPTGLTQSWSGDTGTAGPDLTVNWTAANDAYYYILTLDGVARRVVGSIYSYALDANRAQHSGTPDPVITYSLVAVDGFGQSSAAVSGTATNAAPPSPTATLTQGAVSGLYATVTSVSVPDFLVYEYVYKRDGTTVATNLSASSTNRYEMQGSGDSGYHSWTVVIRQEDVFAQFSLPVTPAAVAFEALTLAGLRAMAGYSDSIGSTTVALAALKDGDTGAGGISYGA